jgi:amidase/aspartyl-tRNA(Asn)/glutamyl-tRNA(Gln) amidotransferase subunit A
MDQTLDVDAVDLAAGIRARRVSSAEAVTAAIAAIERRNPLINAVVTPLFDSALQAARNADAILASREPVGPLHGVPILIKDLFDFKAGVRNTFGCPGCADFVPTETSAHVARLESAGAIVLGKTNTPEFGHKAVTDNRLFGPTRNPFDHNRNAGGSSGGSAAAVAAGMVPLAQGSDAGGSIRIPAAWCGVVGFKPTFGRIPNTGGPNAFDTHSPFVHAGPLARTVRDAALMTQVMAGPHPSDPLTLDHDGTDLLAAARGSIAGLKVAFSADWGVFAVEPEVADVVRQAVQVLEAAGASVDEPDFALPCDQDELASLWRRQVGIVYAEFFAAMKLAGWDILTHGEDAVPADVREMADYGAQALALDARKDQWGRTSVFQAVQGLFERYDLIVTPTTSCLPVPNAADGRTLGPATVHGVAVERCIGWCLTHPLNFTGHPAASAPAGQSRDRLPIGMQIVGRRFCDGTVLAACAAIEERRPWLNHLHQL